MDGSEGYVGHVGCASHADEDEPLHVEGIASTADDSMDESTERKADGTLVEDNRMRDEVVEAPGVHFEPVDYLVVGTAVDILGQEESYQAVVREDLREVDDRPPAGFVVLGAGAMRDQESSKAADAGEAD